MVWALTRIIAVDSWFVVDVAASAASARVMQYARGMLLLQSPARPVLVAAVAWGFCKQDLCIIMCTIAACMYLGACTAPGWVFLGF
jgi:hypothetical protein